MPVDASYPVVVGVPGLHRSVRVGQSSNLAGNQFVAALLFFAAVDIVASHNSRFFGRRTPLQRNAMLLAGAGLCRYGQHPAQQRENDQSLDGFTSGAARLNKRNYLFDGGVSTISTAGPWLC